jgi:hypothetical protein
MIVQGHIEMVCIRRVGNLYKMLDDFWSDRYKWQIVLIKAFSMKMAQDLSTLFESPVSRLYGHCVVVSGI